jgi:4-hydroxyphenylpyruvate dioxygenase
MSNSPTDPVSVVGIRRLEAIHYYVHDLDRSRRFYVDKLDFREIAHSDDALTARGHQRSLVFQAADCRVVCSTPVGEGGRADRYLRKHPAGIGSLVFEVQDIEQVFRALESRGATPVADIETTNDGVAWFKTFVITTPFGDTTFRFVERGGGFALYPGFDAEAPPPGGTSAGNRFGFLRFDHVTSNFETMTPALLWLEHVLGFQRYWEIEFHTDDVSRRADKHGSGLQSVVMWDPGSGVKFANNQPQRPNFRGSQINVFHEEHRGDAVQHVALAVGDIVSAVRGMRAAGVEFMPTPSTYFQALPARLTELGIGALGEPLADLEEQQILVDGDGPGRYLLQIFLKDAAALYASPDAGPFFYEIIQRHGDDGFGAGNFRALFESIERAQTAPGPVADEWKS